MNHDSQPNEEHPVDALLGKALRDTVPSDAESLLLGRIDTFKPTVRGWRIPLTIGGSIAASLAIALVWVLMSPQVQPAHAWEQMRANLAKPSTNVSFWMTQKLMEGPENNQALVIDGQAFVRIKAGKGSRLDAYDLSADRNMERTPDKIRLNRPDGLEIRVDYKAQTLNGIRSSYYPPRKSTKPKTVSTADPFIKRLISTDGATLEGKELIDGRRTLRYSVPSDKVIWKSKDAKNEAEVLVWVDLEHSLPVQWRTRGWSTDETDPWETTVTFEKYVRDEPIDDSVFDLPPQTVLWDRTESWHINLTPDVKLEQPLRIRVDVDEDVAVFTEKDFRASGDRTGMIDGNKLRILSLLNQGKTLRVFLNDQLVAEHVIDWPINNLTVFGPSYWME